MPPSPIPAPLPKWTKWIMEAVALAYSVYREVLDYSGSMNLASEEPPDEWRHIQMKWKSPTDPDPANDIVTTFDIVNITNGAIDNTWDEGDYTAVDTRLGLLASNWATYVYTGYTMFETRYYRRSFAPIGTNPDTGKPYDPFAFSGPPERVFAHNTPGLATTTTLRQAAMTSTEKTPYPRHWGRNYWPLLAGGQVGPTGHLSQAICDALCGFVHVEYSSLMDSEYYPVVPVTQVKNPGSGTGSSAARVLTGVTSIQVDDIPDIIRRRRPKSATYRKELGL